MRANALEEGLVYHSSRLALYMSRYKYLVNGDNFNKLLRTNLTEVQTFSCDGYLKRTSTIVTLVSRLTALTLIVMTTF
jgi:hypothetical protein